MACKLVADTVNVWAAEAVPSQVVNAFKLPEVAIVGVFTVTSFVCVASTVHGEVAVTV